MLQDLSLHIYDLAENGVSAGAKLIQIKVSEMPSTNQLTIVIEDNGKGMDEATLKWAQSPFSTERTARKVGLGIPFMKQACLQGGGTFALQSQPGKGTVLTASFAYDHWDRQPLGEVFMTVFLLVGGHPQLDFYYQHRVEEKEWIFDTREIRKTLQDVPLDHPKVLEWIADYLKENVELLYQ